MIPWSAISIIDAEAFGTDRERADYSAFLLGLAANDPGALVMLMLETAILGGAAARMAGTTWWGGFSSEMVASEVINGAMEISA